jgi:hypothetical protein
MQNPQIITSGTAISSSTDASIDYWTMTSGSGSSTVSGTSGPVILTGTATAANFFTFTAPATYLEFDNDGGFSIIFPNGQVDFDNRGVVHYSGDIDQDDAALGFWRILNRLRRNYEPIP